MQHTCIRNDVDLCYNFVEEGVALTATINRRKLGDSWAKVGGNSELTSPTRASVSARRLKRAASVRVHRWNT